MWAKPELNMTCRELTIPHVSLDDTHCMFYYIEKKNSLISFHFILIHHRPAVYFTDKKTEMKWKLFRQVHHDYKVLWEKAIKYQSMYPSNHIWFDFSSITTSFFVNSNPDDVNTRSMWIWHYTCSAKHTGHIGRHTVWTWLINIKWGRTNGIFSVQKTYIHAYIPRADPRVSKMYNIFPVLRYNLYLFSERRFSMSRVMIKVVIQKLCSLIEQRLLFIYIRLCCPTQLLNAIERTPVLRSSLASKH